MVPDRRARLFQLHSKDLSNSAHLLGQTVTMQLALALPQSAHAKLLRVAAQGVMPARDTARGAVVVFQVELAT
jgi:hypothetical protein